MVLPRQMFCISFAVIFMLTGVTLIFYNIDALKEAGHLFMSVEYRPGLTCAWKEVSMRNQGNKLVSSGL